MSDPKPPRTVADLMEVTGLGRDSVRACIRTGELPGYHVGGRYVIPGEAFDAFCRGEWVPTVRPVFTERVKPLRQTADSQETDAAPQSSDFLKRRSA